jgi:hypothetical protein
MTNDLTPDEELLLIAIKMAEECRDGVDLAELADRLHVDKAEADLRAQRLERRHLIERDLELGSEFAVSLDPMPAAFLWRERQDPKWKSLEEGATALLKNARRGSALESQQLVEATALPHQAVIGLMEEWVSAGRLSSLEFEMGGGAFGQVTGL